jgi:hypothetical protein
MPLSLPSPSYRVSERGVVDRGLAIHAHQSNSTRKRFMSQDLSILLLSLEFLFFEPPDGDHCKDQASDHGSDQRHKSL